MSLDVVRRVRSAYPTPLASTHAKFLTELAPALTAAHGREFGLLLKVSGTNILLPDGTLVSQDVVCDRQGIQWDCLADGEGAAIATWVPVDRDHYTPDPSRFYAVDGEPVPGPSPDELEARVAALEAQVKALSRVALRTDNGHYVCAEDGGPAEPHESVTLTSRDGVGPWESVKVQRGQ